MFCLCSAYTSQCRCVIQCTYILDISVIVPFVVQQLLKEMLNDVSDFSSSKSLLFFHKLLKSTYLMMVLTNISTKTLLKSRSELIKTNNIEMDDFLITVYFDKQFKCGNE